MCIPDPAAVGGQTARMLRYDPPGAKCLGKNQPGAIALRDFTLARFGGASLGIQACRNVAGTKAPSAHKEGRAYDEGFPQPGRGKRNPAGDPAFQWGVANAERLGLQLIIWADMRWSARTPTIRPHVSADRSDNGRHLNHVHWELNWWAAKNLTVALCEGATDPGPQDFQWQVRPTMRRNDVGLHVSEWQLRLRRAIGVDLGQAGKYGAATEKATKDFQKAMGLGADGVAGPATQNAMQWILVAGQSELDSWRVRPTFGLGASGPHVVEWQRRIRAATGVDLGHRGQFGPATKVATEAFQRSIGLPACGVVNEATQNAMQWVIVAGGTLVR